MERIRIEEMSFFCLDRALMVSGLVRYQYLNDARFLSLLHGNQIVDRIAKIVFL